MIRYIVTGALLGVLALAAVIASSVIAPAEARGLHPRCNIDWPCQATSKEISLRANKTGHKSLFSASEEITPRQARRIARADRFRNVEFGSPMYPPETQRSFLQRGATILPHPPGCPRRAFCGCGAAVEVFGRPIRSLWLAARWLDFPRTSPAPGMVAARRGHVFVILSPPDIGSWITRGDILSPPASDPAQASPRPQRRPSWSRPSPHRRRTASPSPARA